MIVKGLKCGTEVPDTYFLCLNHCEAVCNFNIYNRCYMNKFTVLLESFFFLSQMNFGFADLRKQLFNFLPPVVKMDDHSVITEDCQDLNITCTLTTVSSF